MENFIAVGHVLGAVASIFILQVISMLIFTWMLGRSEVRALDEMSILLGKRVNDINNEDIEIEDVQKIGELYSGELLKNRVSDFCGIISTVWSWLGATIQLILMGFVLWLMLGAGIDQAKLAWFVVSVAVFFYIINLVFSVLCNLFFGRHPGEAKRVMAVISDWLENQGAESDIQEDKNEEIGGGRRMVRDGELVLRSRS